MRFLKQGLIGFALLLGLVLLCSSYLFYVRVTNSGLTFTNELHIPPILAPQIEDNTKVFNLTLQHGRKAFLPTGEAQTTGFNGDYLGPTIRVRKGDNVRFNVHNQLDEVTTVHWHGMHVPPEMDGTPHQTIDPGETWQPYYPIMNEASTMWYHPHTHGRTAHQSYFGLTGLYIIDDENSDSLALPKTYGEDDIPLIIQDRLFDDAGDLNYPGNGGMFFGNTMLVNGTYNPFVEVQAKMVRFRILNGSNARVYSFGFSDDREFYQIATDGGLLEAPVPLTRVLLAPGERAEIVVDFADGENVLFKSFPYVDLLTMAENVFIDSVGNGHFDLLQINVVPVDGSLPSSDSSLPQTLNVIERWSEEDADRTRPMVLGGQLNNGQGQNQPGGGRRIPINGKLMDMTRVDDVVLLDDVEIWEIRNMTGLPHPFHIHDIQFLVLDIDGDAPPANLRGWKDTVLVPNNQTVRVITQFTDYANPSVPYMYHCHIMEHEDNGMMGQFVVVEDAPIVKSSEGYWLPMAYSICSAPTDPIP